MSKKALVLVSNGKTPDLMTKEEAWALKMAAEAHEAETIARNRAEHDKLLAADNVDLKEFYAKHVIACKTPAQLLGRHKDKMYKTFGKLAFRLGVPAHRTPVVAHEAFKRISVYFEGRETEHDMQVFLRVIKDDDKLAMLIPMQEATAPSNPQAAATQSKIDQIDAMLATPDLPKHGYYGERSLRVRRAALVVKLESLK